jgi:glycosyltransferase involved in cell wall biosynthesis
MPVTPDTNVLVAQDEASFAEAIARLYENEALWNEFSKASQDFALQEWGVEAAWVSLSKILNDIGFETTRSKLPLTTYVSGR